MANIGNHNKNIILEIVDYFKYRKNYWLLPIVILLILFTSVSSVFAYWNSNMTNGLVSNWKLDETNGSIIYDSLGYANGIYDNANSTIYVQGRIGGALDFSRSLGQQINVTDKPEWDFSNGNWTLSLWFKTNEDSIDDNMLIGHGNSGYPDQGWYIKNQHGDIYFGGWENIEWNTQITGSNDGEWHNLIFRADTNLQNLEVLYDGYFNTSTVSYQGSVENSYPLQLAYSPRYNGQLDDIMIWNRTLTNEEAVSIYLYNASYEESMVIPEEEITQQFPNKITGSGTIYEVMDSTGAGLGKFFDYMKVALPIIMIGLGIVGIVVVIAIGLSQAFNNVIIKR